MNNIKSIQQANLESHVKIMKEAKENNNKTSFNNAKDLLINTLNIIKDIDQNTYNKFIHYLEEEIK